MPNETLKLNKNQQGEAPKTQPGEAVKKEPKKEEKPKSPHELVYEAYMDLELTQRGLFNTKYEKRKRREALEREKKERAQYERLKAKFEKLDKKSDPA
jgi:hypothetical protein